MNWRLLLPLLILGIFSLELMAQGVAPQALDSTSTNIETAVREAQARYQAAWRANDLDALKAVVTADFILTTPEGMEVPLSGVHRLMRDGNAFPALRVGTPKGLQVRLYEGAALLSGTYLTERTKTVERKEKSSRPGQKGAIMVPVEESIQMTAQIRFLEVYVKTQGQWRLAAAFLNEVE